MRDKIIGIMWNKNEADILDETISKALPLVDHLLIADDDSDDASWDIIRSHKSELAYCNRYSESRKELHKDHWQRQHLLNKAKELYGSSIWIQVVESDLIAIDTDIREQVETRTNMYGIGIWWCNLEAVRREWKPEDEMYPNWDRPIQEMMPWCHILEKAPYTWRPYPDIYFPKRWQPHPVGLDKYGGLEGEWYVKKKYVTADMPLWGHYNIRGRKHFDIRYKDAKPDSRAKAKREIVAFTVPQDPTWDDHVFKLNREAWKKQITKSRWVVKSLW